MSQRSLGLDERIRPANRVREGSTKLTGRSGTRRSVLAVLDIDAVRHAGLDPDDPGEISWFYLKREGLLVFDLAGEYTDGGRDE